MIFTMTEVPSARFFASETIVWNETMSETIWKHPAKLRKAKTSLLRYSALCCCTLLYATQLAWYLGDEDLQHRLPRQSGLEVHSESTLNKSFYMPYYMPMVCKQADPENPEAPQKMLRRTQVSGAKVEARTKPAPCVCIYVSVSVSICLCRRFCLSLALSASLIFPLHWNLSVFCLSWLRGEQVAMLAKQPAMRMKVHEINININVKRNRNRNKWMNKKWINEWRNK